MSHSQPLFAPATTDSPARVLVIAELGVNHDGLRDRALDLATAAAAAGADAIKLQLFDPRRLLSEQARLAAYQEQVGVPDLFTLLNRLKLTPQALREVRDVAAKLGVKFIVTPFSVEDVAQARELKPDALKIASPDAVNTPLLGEAATLDVPLIISTGTSEIDELGDAIELLRRHRAGGCLLQCVSNYPTPMDQAALGGMVALGRTFGLPVGYSDHTTELTTGALAVAAGACVVEKHFTYDCGASGPDHAASLDPVSFTHYAELTHQAAVMLGPIAKRLLDCEKEVRDVSRQSVCALADLPAGTVIQRHHVTVKRPGTGIPARLLNQVIGKRLRRDVKANHLVMREDLE